MNKDDVPDFSPLALFRAADSRETISTLRCLGSQVDTWFIACNFLCILPSSWLVSLVYWPGAFFVVAVVLFSLMRT